MAQPPPRLIDKAAILGAIDSLEHGVLLDAMRSAFVAYSTKQVTIADVVHLKMDSKPGHVGDACIKAGYLRGGDRWVVKVASGWPNNSQTGMSNSQGAMMVFSQLHGGLEAVLADDGALTDKRTALAAALSVREFAPRAVKTILLVGTGVIATLVARELLLLDCVDADKTLLVVASRTSERAVEFQEFCARIGWSFILAAAIPEGGFTPSCLPSPPEVVITCTPATAPVFDLDPPEGGGDGDGDASGARPALIVALGADGAGKRELGPRCFGAPVVVVADSLPQCVGFGECAHVVGGGLDAAAVVELGATLGRALEEERGGAGGWDRGLPVVVDLTGVAAQDVAIASLVMEHVARTA